MLRVLVRLSSLSERRAPTAAMRRHRGPVIQQVGVHRLFERLTTRRAQRVLVRLQGQRHEPVNLTQRTERGDGERQGTRGPQFSEDRGGLRVSETLCEKSGTATLLRIRSLASFTTCAHCDMPILPASRCH